MSRPVDFKYDTGDQVKCKITGFTGIITSRTEWTNGCKRYGVQPPIGKKDTKCPDPISFDEGDLELVKAGKVVPAHVAEAGKVAKSASQTKAPGGPQRGEAAVMRR